MVSMTFSIKVMILPNGAYFYYHLVDCIFIIYSISFKIMRFTIIQFFQSLFFYL